MPFIYFRRHQKKVLWITVLVIIVAFSLFGVYNPQGGAGKNIKGYVMGKKVSNREFYEAYERWHKFSLLHGRTRPMQESEMWDNYALPLVADTWGLKIPDTKIVERVKTTFGEDDFDLQNVQRILSQYHLTVEDYEQTLEEMLKRNTLLGNISSTVKITDDEARHLYRFEKSTVNVALVRFKADKFTKEVEVNEGELALFFKDRQELYRTPDKFKFEYVAARLDDLEKQAKVTEEEIKQYYEKNKDSYKKAPPTDDEKKEEEETEKKTEYRPIEEVKEGIESILKREKAEKTADEKIRKVEKKILEAADSRESDLETLAKEAGLEHEVTEPLDSGKIRSHKDLAGPQAKIEQICSLEDRYPSSYVKGHSSYFIARLLEKQESAIPEFSVIQEKVKEDFVSMKAAEKALEAARSFTEIAKESSFEEVAKKQELEIEKHENLTRMEMSFKIPGGGRELARQILDTPQGGITEAVPGFKDAFAAKVTERKEPEFSDFDKEKDALIQRYRSAKINQVLDDWLGSLDIRCAPAK